VIDILRYGGWKKGCPKIRLFILLTKLFFWGLRSKAAALRFGARCSLGPSFFAALKNSVWPDGHPAASLGQSLRSFAAASPPAIYQWSQPSARA